MASIETTRNTTSTQKETMQKDIISSSRPKKKKITFTLPAPEAQNVSLVGDFNNWDYTNTMKRDKDGLWKTRVELEPGKYEYRYLVDGQWQNDPNCQNVQLNSFGTYNCIVEVSN